MAYNNAIPQPADILSDSQDDILNNFIAIDNFVNVNHGQFNTAFEGKHFEVTLPRNGAPTPTLATEANLFSQLSTMTNTTELAWQRQNNGQTIEFTSRLGLQTGWTIFPSGVIMKWGFVATNNVPTLVTFPVGVNTPAFDNLVLNNPFNVQVSVVDNNDVVAVVTPATVAFDSFTVETFTANTGAGVASNIYYLAIGI